MMKGNTILRTFIITAIVSSTACAQDFYEGTYFTNKKQIGFESEIFQFKKDGSFGYILKTDTGIKFGKGNFERKKSLLTLYFEGCEECAEKQELTILKDSADTLQINIRVEAFETGKTLPGTNTGFLYSDVWTEADKQGIIRLKVPKFSERKVLKLTYIGFDDVSILVESEFSTIDGVVRLTDNSIYPKGEALSFKVSQWKKSRLKMKRSSKNRILYDKVNKAEANSLIMHRIGENNFNFYKKKIFDYEE